MTRREIEDRIDDWCERVTFFLLEIRDTNSVPHRLANPERVGASVSALSRRLERWERKGRVQG